MPCGPGTASGRPARPLLLCDVGRLLSLSEPLAFFEGETMTPVFPLHSESITRAEPPLKGFSPRVLLKSGYCPQGTLPSGATQPAPSPPHSSPAWLTGCLLTLITANRQPELKGSVWHLVMSLCGCQARLILPLRPRDKASTAPLCSGTRMAEGETGKPGLRKWGLQREPGRPPCPHGRRPGAWGPPGPPSLHD